MARKKKQEQVEEDALAGLFKVPEEANMWLLHSGCKFNPYVKDCEYCENNIIHKGESKDINKDEDASL